MPIEVQHWSGAGNRFVIVDGRQLAIAAPWDTLLVSRLCKRVNLADAEGVLVLRDSDTTKAACRYDFYNPDGSTGVMCGNGARCAVRHAVLAGDLQKNTIDLGLNGRVFNARLVGDDRVALRLPLFHELRLIDAWTYVDVGSRHVVVDARDLVASVDEFDRFDLHRFANDNLNFYREKVGIVSLNLNIAYPIDGENTIHLRTYENGVFNETQACGTGAVSTAVAFWTRNVIRQATIEIVPTSGRVLTVHLDLDEDKQNILGMILEGDARQDTSPSRFDPTAMQYL